MNKLLSVVQVAQYLKVSNQQVSSLLREGLLIGERIGKQWIIAKASLEQYILENNIIIEPNDYPRASSHIPDVVALSFFSGAMGLDLGLEKAGINPVLVCEFDKETRKTIHANRPDIALIGDINNYTAAEVIEYANLSEDCPIDIIVGGPPCQAFSTAGKQKAFDDERGNVFLTYIDLCIELDPTYIVIENVRGLLYAEYSIDDLSEPIKGGALYHIVTTLEHAGYSVSFELYNSANFGAPQIRERIIMICKKGENPVDYLSPTHAENADYSLKPWVTLGETIEDLNVTHHFVAFPEKRLKYYRMLKEGQNWRDLPLKVQPDAMGGSYALSGGKTGFYRRLDMKRPSPTLVTHPAMPATDLCHPTEERPLSIEEYKRIQGFPDNWKICGSLLDIYRQIGNAVPLPVGEAVGKTLLADMSGQRLPQYKGFKHSRYKNTNHTLFMRKIEKEIAVTR